MEFAQGLLLITGVHLLAAATPGPDFIMVTQQTLANGRKAGLLVSLGIALGLSVHILYSALGLAAVVASSAAVLWGIKILGGSYLLYLGISGLRAKRQTHEIEPTRPQSAGSTSKTIALGFLCNALNPKAPVYFVALFTLVLSPQMPLYQLVSYGLWIMCLQFFWFALVATLLASPPVSKKFNSCGHYLHRVCGGVMLILGIKVLTSKTL